MTLFDIRPMASRLDKISENRKGENASPLYIQRILLSVQPLYAISHLLFAGKANAKVYRLLNEKQKDMVEPLT